MVEKILLIIVLELLYNAIYSEKSKGWLNKNYWMKEKFYLSQFYFNYYYYYYYYYVGSTFGGFFTVGVNEPRPNGLDTINFVEKMGSRTGL